MTSRSITNGTTLLTYTLSYDGLDHLVRWNDMQTTANEEWYMYDGSGQRVLRRSQTGTGTSNTKYTVYAFGVQDDVYDGSGASYSDKYYYSLAGRLIGELNGGKTKFLLTDLLGSVVASISNTVSSAAVLGNQVYGPYGNGSYSKGTITTPKGYTGQYNDSLTQLDYYNARYYDPFVGVFLSADTASGNLAGMNPYAYVNGNPETHSDPTGRYIAGPGGQTYYPGSPYYTQGGEAYSVQTGQAYNGDGFVNGWYPGHGPNAQSTIPFVGGLKTTIQGGKFAVNLARFFINLGFKNLAGAITDVWGAFSTQLPSLDNNELWTWVLERFGIRTTDHGALFASLSFRDSTVGGLGTARSILGTASDILAFGYAAIDLFTNSDENARMSDLLTIAAVVTSKIARDLIKANGDRANLNSRLASGLSLILTAGSFIYATQAVQSSSGSSGSGDDRDNRDRSNGGGGGFPPLSLLPALLAPSFLIPNNGE